jgi:hypothetical protein
VAELRIAPRAPYVLYRVHPDGIEEPVSEHYDFRSGWQAGTHVALSIPERVPTASTNAGIVWRALVTAA